MVSNQIAEILVLRSDWQFQIPWQENVKTNFSNLNTLPYFLSNCGGASRGEAGDETKK